MHKADKEDYCRIWQELLDSGDIKGHIDIHLKERKPLIDCMLKHIENKPRPIKVLEVGCGTAIDSYNLMSSFQNIDVCAVDYSWQSLVLAKKISGCFPGQIKLLLNDALRLAFKNETFDVVFSQGLIEHFRDPAAIIREQMRVLKNDGLLIIDVPQRYNAYTVLKHRSITRGTWPWGWESEYSYFGLKRLGGRLGLTAVDRCGHGSSAFFGLVYARFWPRRIRPRAVYASGGKLLNRLLKLCDGFSLRLDRRYGHLYLQDVAVIFRKERLVSSSEMNICMISGSFHPLRCGIADYTFLLSRVLAKKNVNLSVVTGAVKNQPEKCLMDKILVLRIMKEWALPELLKLLSIIKQNSSKIVHIQYNATLYNNHIMINLLPLFIKRFMPGVKVVITFHEMIGPGIFWKLWFYVCLKFTDRIIMTNKKYADILLRQNPSSINKISIITVGGCVEDAGVYRLTDEERSSLRQGLNVDGETILIVSFGLIFPNKELEVLIRAAKSIIEEGKKIKLIFIGGESDIFPDLSMEYRDKIDQYIKSLGMEEFVIRLGFMDSSRILKMIQCSDMAVLLYKNGVHSGCCSFITVLSCGLPVITTAGETAMEGLVNYKNTLLLKNNETAQLKQYMLELINDKQLRARLSSQAWELSKRYTWDVISERTKEVYSSLNNK